MHGTVMLGDHVKVLRQGTIGDGASSLLHGNSMPRPIEMTCQPARVVTSRRVDDGDDGTREFETCRSICGCRDWDGVQTA